MKENMLVASYYGSIGACNCQVVFKEVLNQFVEDTNYNVYLFNSQEIKESKDDYKLLNLGYSSPILYIINKGIVKQTFLYSQKANEKIFISNEELTKKVNKYFSKPDLFYVNKDYIDKNLKGKDSVGLCFIRESCDDCKYLIPNFMIPYVNEHDLKKEVWVFDIDPYKQTDTYQSLKDEYFLSESTSQIFGYGNGVVPTTQYYEKGKLIDANVYLNDELQFDEISGEYTIKTTYYTANRINNLNYIDDTYILENKTIKKEEVVSNHWLPLYSSKIHNEIIKNFYDKYFI